MPAHDASPSLPEPHTEIVTTSDGGRIHCSWAGSGPTVVLAHGYLLDHGIFEPLLRALAGSGYRAIAFDQRAHARSVPGSTGSGSAAAASDYAALLEHFEVQDGVLVGHSMGAFLGLVFCLQHADVARRRLRRLVLLGPNAGAVSRGSLQNRIQSPLLRSGLLQPMWRTRSLGRALVRPLFGADPDPRQVEQVREILARADVPASLPLLHAMNHEDYYAQLGQIPFDVRVLCGELDRTCPPWHSRRLGRELPRASVQSLPRLGHMLCMEAPQLVLDAVRAQS